MANKDYIPNADADFKISFDKQRKIILFGNEEKKYP